MTEYWIIPCNLGVFDVVKHFESSSTVVWKNSFSIRKGDYVYIYIGNPLKQILYKCQVINDEVDQELLKKNPYAVPKKKSNNFYSKKEKYIELELITRFPEGSFSLNTLKKHGLGQVQIQARAPRSVREYLVAKESQF